MYVLLVGAGNMAAEYVKVLDKFNVDYSMIGRSEESATAFEKRTGKLVLTGGLEVAYARLVEQPTHAIVATTLESLEENTLYLLEKGVKQILVEKPGALSNEGMNKIMQSADKHGANVYIAYNRRFYASVMAASKLIKEDGGLTSFLFEFTEWSHIVGGLNKTPTQLDNWFIGNSTHVVDLAFFFGGKPKEISSYTTSTLEWHPKGSIYAGAGVTEKKIFFSYHANWQAPGSWKLELLTNMNRYIFRPLEELHVQKIGSATIENVEIEDRLDVQYKPGLYEQTAAFLFQTELSDRLLRVKEALMLMHIYERMNDKGSEMTLSSRN
ncbi:Gfo/Idh/MocA family oxidoreductase [Sporosarcina sp. FSL K6-2383]|uniref:Gfo/Idh/MocA family oxidoreductase n=1 Tax=Sporosarcina sp. FSL K6-2383 TaxID=2921556 RepID=UPI00315A80AE